MIGNSQTKNPIENYIYWTNASYHGWFNKLISRKLSLGLDRGYLRLPEARDEVEVLLHQIIQERKSKSNGQNG